MSQEKNGKKKQKVVEGWWWRGGGTLGEQRGFSAASFVLLAQWPSVNATHRASLPERTGDLCDRVWDGERV